jgi:hypothetical protein
MSRYGHGKRLEPEALAAREDEREAALAQHLLGTHGVGIVTGLETSRGLLLQSVAHDREGRQIVLTEPQALTPEPSVLGYEPPPEPDPASPECPPPRRRRDRAVLSRRGSGLTLSRGAELERAGARGQHPERLGRCPHRARPAFRVWQEGSPDPALEVAPAGEVSLRGGARMDHVRATRLAFPPGLEPEAPRPRSFYAVSDPESGGTTLRLEIADPGDAGDPSRHMLRIMTRGRKECLRIAADGSVGRTDDPPLDAPVASPRRITGQISATELVRQPLAADSSDPDVLAALVNGFLEGAAAAACPPILYGMVVVPPGVEKARIAVAQVGTGRSTETTENGTFVIGEAGQCGALTVARLTGEGVKEKYALGLIGRFLVGGLGMTDQIDPCEIIGRDARQPDGAQQLPHELGVRPARELQVIGDERVP